MEPKDLVSFIQPENFMSITIPENREAIRGHLEDGDAAIMMVRVDRNGVNPYDCHIIIVDRKYLEDCLGGRNGNDFPFAYTYLENGSSLEETDGELDFPYAMVLLDTWMGRVHEMACTE